MVHKIFVSILILLQFTPLTAAMTGNKTAVKAMAAVPGLVAAYGFEEGTGSTLADTSGNSNNGTLQNGPVWVTNGKFGKALQFDGANDRVRIPDSNSLDLTTGMTLEAWVYPTSNLSGWDGVLVKEYASGQVYSIFANGDGNKPHTYISSNNTNYGTTGGTTLPANTWTHLASTFNGSTIRLFVNGTQVSSASFSGSIQTSTGMAYIAGSSFLSNEGFPGIIDEIRIYNRALSVSEIASDMNTPVAGTPVPTASPTRTATAAASPTRTPTAGPSPTRTATTIVTATRTPTMAPTPTRTAMAIFTPTRTPTSGFTPTATATSGPQSLGPLRASTVNPRYFANPSGNIVYLTGSHTWCNLIDCDDANPILATFNYTAFLDFLIARNHNFFRLWRAENARGGEAGPNFWFSPMPYQRSSTCCAFDGGNKFNLNSFNQAYFDRMRQRIIAARDRGIYVSVMLFDGWSVESKMANHNPWAGHPYKDTNNINNIDGDLNNDNQGGETHTLSNAQVTALQEAYIRKVIDTVNDLDNVLYEISNESPGNSEAWQYHMINYIKNYQATKPKQHPVGMTVEYPSGSNTDLYNSPADWISLAGNGTNIDTYTPPPATGNKVILADTDHLCGICGNRQWVWRSFTRGENPIFMDVYDPATTSRGMYLPPTGNEVEIRANLGYTRNYATRMNLAAMTPQPALCSTGYCLAKTTPAAEYLAYLPSGGSITINLSSTPGTLTVEWFRPSNGTTTNGGTVSGGASRTLTPPFPGDAVLYLKSQ